MSRGRNFDYPHWVRKLIRRRHVKRQKGLCYYCRQPMIQPTLDHIVPKSKGGKASKRNTVACCLGCNAKKADQVPA
ncbi:MAG: HNH endonuclease [Rhodospirillales bacterium]|jgi:5-methylcytosine-specific restriction endonuclease McrA